MTDPSEATSVNSPPQLVALVARAAPPTGQEANPLIHVAVGTETFRWAQRVILAVKPDQSGPAGFGDARSFPPPFPPEVEIAFRVQPEDGVLAQQCVVPPASLCEMFAKTLRERGAEAGAEATADALVAALNAYLIGGAK